MRRNSLVAGVLSLLGAATSLGIALALHNMVSMYTAIGVVLFLNAAVRFRLASTLPDEEPDR